MARSRYPLDSHGLDLGWEVAGFLVALGGLALRIITIGAAPRGTSGRSTRTPKARVLNTTGAYPVVRHPLYLGNGLIALGVSCFPRAWCLPLIVSLAALLYYERIALREAKYLEEKFGAEFRRWAVQTPAILPSLRHYQPVAMTFSWRKALRGEYAGAAKVTALFVALDVLQEVVITRRLTFDPLWMGRFAVGAVLFVVLRTMKKRGLLADQAITPTGQRADEAVVESPRDHAC